MIQFIFMMFILLMGYQIQFVKHGRYNFVLGRYQIKFNTSIFIWCLLAITIAAFGGVRYEMGADFTSYQLVFQNIIQNREGSLRHPFSNPWVEGGYVLLNVAVSYMSTDPQSIIIVTSAVIAVLLLYAASKSEYIPIALFVALTTYFTSYTLIRQGIACGLLVLAIYCLYSGEKKKAYILMALALTFHTTSIAFILPLILSQIRFKKAHYTIGVLISILAFFFRGYISYIFTALTYSEFLENSYYLENIRNRPSTIDSLVAIICMYFCFAQRKRILEDNKNNIIYINLVYVFFITSVLLYWLPFMFRLRMYYYAPMMYALPKLLKINADKWQQSDVRKIVFAMMIAVYILNFTSLTGYSGYNTIWGLWR